MARWVLLRHAVREGEVHLDWMIERPAATDRDRKLLSFRLPEGTDLLGATEFVAERIGDHRNEYLEYEGPVSGGRGEVWRVASGECELEIGPDSVRVLMGGRTLLGREEAGRRRAGGVEGWRFELASGG